MEREKEKTELSRLIWQCVFLFFLLVAILASFAAYFKSHSASSKLRLPSSNENNLLRPSSSLTPATTLIPTNRPGQIQQKLPTLNGSTIFSLVNSYRAENGLPFFSVSDELCRIAERRADLMIANARQAFKDSSPGGNTNFDSDAHSYSGGGMGENLAMNATSDKGVLNLWINSPPHKQLLLISQRDGVSVTKACVATRVAQDGSIVVLLVGDK